MVDIDEDEVPPLEDMSEAIAHCLKLRGKDNSAKMVKCNEFLDISNDVETLKAQKIKELLGSEKNEADKSVNNERTLKGDSRTPESEDTYCGFKKGFLLSTEKNKRKPKQSTNAMKEKVIEIKKQEKKEEKNVLPEVQEAMKQNIPLLQSQEWVTDDLLNKISANPKLSKQFCDPRFSEAIANFQSNPRGVMAMCQHNSELREFIQEFCAVMGDHFTGIADKDEGKTKKESIIKESQGKANSSNKDSPAPDDEDEEKVRKILSDPEVASILQTADIQQLFAFLKTDPKKSRRMLQTADDVLRRKIQKLIDVGLLQFAG